MDEGRLSVGAQIRITFLRGIGIIIPLGLTYWFFQALLNAIDGIFSPILEQWIGREIPGLGFITMIAVILLVGLLTRNIAGRILFGWVENLLRSIPFVRSVYTAVKDLISAFVLGDKSRTFREVVMVEYPRQGLFCIGFVTNIMQYEGLDGARREFVNVYIPNPPNPTSGFLVLVPRKDAVTLALTIEEGLKLVLSGGIVVPETLKPRRLPD